MSTATLKAAPTTAQSAAPELNPEPTDADVRRRIFAYLVPHRSHLILGLLCGTLAAIAEGDTALLLKNFIDGLENKNNGQFLIYVCAGIVALYALMGILRYSQNVLLSTAAQRIGHSIRSDVYAKFQKFSLGFFHVRRTGSLMSTLQSDVPKIQNSAMMLKDAITAPINVIIFLSLLLQQSWQLTLFLLLAVPLMAVTIQSLTRRLRAMSLETQGRLGDLAAVMEETLAAPRIVRAFTAEQREVERFDQASEHVIDSQLRAMRRSARLGPTVDLIGSFGVATVLFVGGTLVLRHHMTTGALLTFLLLASKIATSVNAIGGIKSTYEEMMGAADRVFRGVMDIAPEIVDTPHAIALPPVQGRITFEGLSFSYNPEAPVLHNINLTIEPGQVVAFVGETGAGKSTLADLLPRFYDPTEGRITVDGYDLRDVTVHSLRSQIGIVPQENILFSGTIRDNLIYGRPDATDEEVRSAAQATNIADFIESLPDGYETRVGERGTTLSGGQRQRIAIARALLKNPRMLILDEATSALDAKTEASVQAALDTLMKGRTTVIIAHRLSTIAAADKIVVLSHGRIAEIGTHAELLTHDGIYARLYATQQRQIAVQQEETIA